MTLILDMLFSTADAQRNLDKLLVTCLMLVCTCSTSACQRARPLTGFESKHALQVTLVKAALLLQCVWWIWLLMLLAATGKPSAAHVLHRFTPFLLLGLSVVDPLTTRVSAKV